MKVDSRNVNLIHESGLWEVADLVLDLLLEVLHLRRLCHLGQLRLCRLVW